MVRVGAIKGLKSNLSDRASPMFSSSDERGSIGRIRAGHQPPTPLGKRMLVFRARTRDRL
jgi:hypothetical protein